MNWYPYLIASMIGNIILMFCLFSPGIVYLLHKQFFNWKTDSEEYKSLQKEKKAIEDKMRKIINQ